MAWLTTCIWRSDKAVEYNVIKAIRRKGFVGVFFSICLFLIQPQSKLLPLKMNREIMEPIYSGTQITIITLIFKWMTSDTT